MERLKHIDCVRGLGIIAVVWVHVAIRMAPEIGFALGLPTRLLATSSYIPILFIISGCLASATIRNSDLGYWRCVGKFMNSTLRPFYVLSFIFFLMNVVGSTYIDKLPGAAQMLCSLITLNIDDNLPSGVLWFFFTLFMFSITLLTWHRRVGKYYGALFLIGLLLRVFMPGGMNEMTYFSLNRYASNLCFYIFGFMFSDFILEKRPKTNVIYLSLVIYAPMLVASCANVLRAGGVLDAIMPFGGCLLVVSLMKMATRRDGGKTVDVLAYIGANTLVVFVFHMPFLRLMERLLSAGRGPGAYWVFTAWFAAALMGPLLVGEFFARFPAAHRFVFGRLPARSAIGRP